MTDERALRAIRKIEQGLGRIEAVANRPRPPSATAESEAELARLREAHGALRAKVAAAIGEIDQLLEAEGG